jgi:hypothetical protein
MKKVFKFFSIIAITLLTVSKASAQNPHLLSPLNVTDNGTTLTVCYDMAGLGNVTQTALTVNFTQTITTICTNNGGNVAPGLVKTVKGSQTFMVAVTNGRATGCVTTTEPAPGKCPNGQTASVSDVSFSNVSVSIEGKTFKAPNP